MSYEEIIELTEEISIHFIDIEEKDYQDLAKLLNQMDELKKKTCGFECQPYIIQLNSVYQAIERLILFDIDPFDNKEAFITQVYESIDRLKLILIQAQKGILQNDKEIANAVLIQEEAANTATKTPPTTAESTASQLEDNEIFSDFLIEAKEYIDELEVFILELEKKPRDKEIINRIFRPFHTIKGVTGFLGLKKLNLISHEAESLLDQARNAKIQITSKVIQCILAAIDAIKYIVTELGSDTKEEKISDADLDKLINVLKSAAIMGDSTTNDEPEFQWDKPTENQGRSDKKSTDDSVRVKTEKLDFLIDMVGELVINFNLIKQDKNITAITNHDFSKKISQLYRVVSELQKASMSLRMIPIGNTFQKMNRVIRDYSTQHKKPITLVLRGEETEIDRNIVDSLYDPLVHMIRNSCDHGIESEEERLKSNKPTQGTIQLYAYHKGNSLIIEICDDGKGLNKEAIIKKARERGFAVSDIISDEEIYSYIFQPGFSTAEVVTNVSGRGVGMDIVSQTIRTLNGEIKVKSEAGVGSTFQIILPLTLAIIDGMLIRSGNELYIIPIVNVIRSLKPNEEQLNLVLGKGESVRIEDKLYPIVRLSKSFSSKNEERKLGDCLLILIQSHKEEFVLAVDELVGIQDVVVKNLGIQFKDLKGVSGATILGDGTVGLILDVNSLSEEL